MDDKRPRITSAQVRPFKEAASPEARALLDMLATARRERDSMYLTLREVDRVARWKLRGQYHRTQHLRTGWTDATIRQLTAQALAAPVLPTDDDLCDLSNMSLVMYNISGNDLSRSNLSGSDLRYADLTNANLTLVNLTSAKLANADLTGALGTPAWTSGAVWSDTTCPDGTNSDQDGNTCAGHFLP
jgi:hypothetical protein